MKGHPDFLPIIAGSSIVSVDGTDRGQKGIDFPVTSSRATIHDDDERLLAQIGYKQVVLYVMDHDRVLTVFQELRREFTRWSTVSYAISILGVLGSVPATFGSPLMTGGPATAVWCWFIGSCMAMCIASSGTTIEKFK